MKDIRAQVEYQKKLPGGYYRLGLKTDMNTFVPGQFGMLQVPAGQGVFLRRPFSLARQNNGITEILYKVVGRGTENLSQVAPGAELFLLGPLGSGFSQTLKGKDLVGVAGGYGVAPFWELGAQLQSQGKTLDLFYGVRSHSDLMYLEELAKVGVRVHVATQDGSQGFKGLVTELLDQHYPGDPPHWIGSCGPMGMLKAVGRWAELKDVSCELSVEEVMGCGTGVCLGCVVKDREGDYLRSCIEGPVFNSKILDLS
ncbi:MAG: dihydroorotate dehydrogenase electron transfer subunit [bacterium]|nr:dihydroorotate dehydrogenase electron transfer subunit [bacterium]